MDSFLHKLTLGTVQLGLNYGINNKRGKPSTNEVFEILDLAASSQISSLDTALAYGNAVQLIGLYHKSRKHRFNILNKFKGIDESKIVENTKITLDELGISSYEVYSYHSFQEYHNFPHIIDHLNYLKSHGYIKKIGVSIYSNSEFEQIIDDENIDVVQLPYNLLDNNNHRKPYMFHAHQKKKEIHVRSIFLQGLFFKELNNYPVSLIKLKPYVSKIKEYCQTKSIDIGTLALSYAVYNDLVDNILIGVDSVDQLIMNLNSINENEEAFRFIDESIHVNEIYLLNPSHWS